MVVPVTTFCERNVGVGIAWCIFAVAKLQSGKIGIGLTSGGSNSDDVVLVVVLVVQYSSGNVLYIVNGAGSLSGWMPVSGGVP